MTHRNRILMAVVACITVAASQASARLPDPGESLRDMRTIKAVHAPTGCAAEVFLIDGAVSRATIVDPTCLPRGVAEREVPGSRHDFHFAVQ